MVLRIMGKNFGEILERIIGKIKSIIYRLRLTVSQHAYVAML